MEERPEAPERAEPLYDIFLCTRELPDQLTGETAALRQLCSALTGEGYKVFFPSALPKDMPDQQRAEKIVEALQSSGVMVAAGIGTEGLDDPFSRKLWSEFRKDPARPFFLCWREQGDAPFPEELAGVTPFDMSELTFLVKLKEQLAGLLPAREIPEEPPEVPEETPEQPGPAEEELSVPEVETAAPETADEPAEELLAEGSPAEEEAEDLFAGESPAEAASAEKPAPAPAKKTFPWKWLLLAAAVLVLIFLIKNR